MDAAESRARFTTGRLANLATAGADGSPHVVPIVFVLVDDAVYSAVDAKPKTTTRLRRLANIDATGRASVLVDAYDEDWTRLWWVRADGAARVLDAASDEGRAAIDALVAKYTQYAGSRPGGPVLRVTVDQWIGWSGKRLNYP